MSDTEPEITFRTIRENLLTRKAKLEMISDHPSTSIEGVIAKSMIMTLNELINLWTFEEALCIVLKQNFDNILRQYNEITTTLADASSIEELKQSMKDMKEKWSTFEPKLQEFNSLLKKATESYEQPKEREKDAPKGVYS